MSALRPVTFHFKRPQLDAPGADAARERPLHYGLIAEEVAELLPTLVSYDDQGRPSTVRYELLTPLLLNQYQRQEKELAALRERVAEQDRQLVALRRHLDRAVQERHSGFP